MLASLGWGDEERHRAWQRTGDRPSVGLSPPGAGWRLSPQAQPMPTEELTRPSGVPQHLRDGHESLFCLVPCTKNNCVASCVRTEWRLWDCYWASGLPGKGQIGHNAEPPKAKLWNEGQHETTAPVLPFVTGYTENGIQFHQWKWNLNFLTDRIATWENISMYLQNTCGLADNC